MSKYFCNPMNIPYTYQYNQAEGKCTLNREAADPSMILFKGKYYLFPSMNRGFYVSENLADWEYHPYPELLPAYDYAPDVRQIGEWMYFSASRRGVVCDFYRTKDPLTDEFERIEGNFDFWDPNLFCDDDGRVYFYYGCSNATPIWGVELDPITMHPKNEPKELVFGKQQIHGFERLGIDHHYKVEENYVLNMMKASMAAQMGCDSADIDAEFIIEHSPEESRPILRAVLSDNPFIEGAWMTKYEGKYYLQYSSSGAEFHTYNDGVYIGDTPLGPFEHAKNNPYSYSPGGFCPGAGHGSTMEDLSGNWWHTATMRISVNHMFERRVGIWPAGFDKDGELFCNQRYGDWPQSVTQGAQDPWAEPQWMLLSYGKPVSVSSNELTAKNITDENVQSWWKADNEDKSACLVLNLEDICQVNAMQINFADDMGLVDLPEGASLKGDEGQGRYIEERTFYTRWLLEGSTDGENWETLCDKREAKTDLPHDFLVWEEGKDLQYLRLTVTELPYQQPACVSGLRVFGRKDVLKPAKATVSLASRTDDMSMLVQWQEDDGDHSECGKSVGYEILWGHEPEKLYHSYRVFAKNEQEIRALVAGTDYYVRVDSFNEAGITHGDVVKVQ